MKVETKELKTLTIRENDRSSNFVAPSFSQGCYSECVYCVEEGTFIMTPFGQKKVEEIQEGDEVISFSLNTFQFEKDLVTSLSQRQTHELYEISLGEETLFVTEEHPFYVKDKGWVEAKYLTEDDVLLYGSHD